MNSEIAGHIAALYRYPVKGLSPEKLARATLQPGQTIAWDRAFALETGSADFDAASPRHFPKTKFLMLMKHERLARLETLFDEASTTLIIRRNGEQCAAGNLLTAAGRQTIEDFFLAFMAGDGRGKPRLVHAPGFSISDVPAKCLSIINLASIGALERILGRPVDPRRMRGNVYIEGLEPWADHDWSGRTLCLGTATLRGLKPIVRCAATNVDPSTGARDMDIPATLVRAFGHSNLGLYAEVISPGTIAPNDGLKLMETA